jgi:hypothetical protein
MVAYAPYVAATASLSSVYHASSVVPKVFSTVSTCKVVTATVTQYASARPTNNAHGHGGPYYNPYNDVDLPFVWPGKPSHGVTYAPPQPSPPYQYGGPAKDQYKEPCWIPSDVDKLVPSLPSHQQCGNSNWGDIDCPHLPIHGLPRGNATKTYPTYGTGTSTPTNSACPTMPVTGVTRTYDLHVAYQTIAPDGVTRNGLTVNGQYPGPLVEANWYVFTSSSQYFSDRLLGVTGSCSRSPTT